MALNLNGMSPKELEALIRDAQSQMTAARAAQIESVRTKINALLKTAGVQLADVYPGRGGKLGKRVGAGIPKYRNPANPAQTWTGHGKKPAWFLAALRKTGVTEASLLIAGGAATKQPIAHRAMAKAATSGRTGKKKSTK